MDFDVDDCDSSNELQESSLSVFYDSDGPEQYESNENLPEGDEVVDGQKDCHLPLYVIELRADSSSVTVNWLVSRIQTSRRHGGAGLRVSVQAPVPGQGAVLHISASRACLLHTAERIQLRVRDVNTGHYRQFFDCHPNQQHGDEFGAPGNGSDNSDALLTTSQKQRIVRHELDRMRAPADELHVPGRPDIRLYSGQSVIRLLISQSLITQIFPTHEPEMLRRLGASWYAAIFQRQPFEEIRAYFGESVTMYFSFVGFYTTALFGPALLGLLQMMIGVDSAHEYALYCIFNMLWITFFLEIWKRKCSSLAYMWGVLDKTQLSFLEPRANHTGEMRLDPITGRYMTYYPRWKTLAKLYLISFPTVLLCLLLSFYLMLLSFWGEEYITLNRRSFGNNLASILILVPSVIYSAVVLVLNKCYDNLASALTEWENHRTQKQFDYYRVIKLALFEFVNSFMCLFYIAFYMQDMDMLRGQLAVMLIVQQLINNFQEALLPIVIRSAYSKFDSWLKGRASAGTPSEKQQHQCGDFSVGSVNAPIVCDSDPCVREVQRQLKLDPYPDTHSDYLQMYVQFGYAFLFSSVFPMAAFWAVLNNVLEIRADAFKLCRLQQRPAVKVVRNIGAWMPAFEVLGFIAACTNCALLCLAPTVRATAPDLSGSDWLVVFLLAEHVLLAAKLLLQAAVPSTPGWIRKAVARQQYTLYQQLMKQKRNEALKLRGTKSGSGKHKEISADSGGVRQRH